MQGSTCTTTAWEVNDAAAGTYKHKNRGAFWWWFFGSYFIYEGQAKCATTGRCTVDFTWFPNLDADPNYDVLQMSSSIQVVYGCGPTFLGMAVQEDAFFY